MAHNIHTPNNMIFMENQRNSDIEISMLPSPSPTKKIRAASVKRSWSTPVRGFKLSNLVLTVAIGIIIIIEIKIMYETTRTYNESLVNQLSTKNEMLENTLINLTGSHNERNELLQKLIQLNEEFKVDAMNQSERLEDKIEDTQQLVIQLAKENKVMYSNGEKNFMETMDLVKEALTMNTNTVIRLLDENNAIQNKLHNLEETVASSHRDRGKTSAWLTNSATPSNNLPFAVILIVSFFVISY